MGSMDVEAGRSCCIRARHGRSARACQQRALVLATLSLLAITSTHPRRADAAGGDVSAQAKGALAREVEKVDVDVDPFLALKPDVRRSWILDGGRLINDTIRRVVAMPVTVIVEVKLVGFDGRGYQQLRIGDADLRYYLGSLQTTLDTVVLEPQLSALPVYPVFHWQVSHDNGQLGSSLEAAIKLEASRIKGATGTGHGQGTSDAPLLVHYHLVDDIIAHDTSRSSSVHLTVYLLNLNTGVGKYLYRYTDRQPAGSIMGDEEMPGFCPGTHYVSPSTVRDSQQARQGPGAASPRYLWIDITAGPASYGPGARQQGHVYEHSLPHPSAFKVERLPSVIAPQLAGMVWSASQHLAWPPLQHAPEPFKKQVTLLVIHMHERLSGHSAGPSERFRLSALQDTLQSILGNLQAVSAREVWLPMSQCPLCVEAFTSSLKVRNAREESSNLLAAQALKVLDPITMHRLATRYLDGIYGYAGLEFEPHPDEERVLPVLVWHVRGSAASDPLLFTSNRQAVAFPNMVLAVSSGASTFHTSATCGLHQMVADGQDVTRPVLGAVLQAGWGLANTSTSYTPATGISSNHVWALTNTPWGWLSASSTVSAPLAMLLSRNLVLGQLNSTSARLVALLAGFSRLSKSGRFDASAAGDMKDRVVTRVNLAAFKASMATTLMSQAAYDRALKYAMSIEHDLGHLEKLAFKIAITTRTALDCKAEPSTTSVWWAPIVAIALWPAAWMLRGRLYRKKADKLY